MDPGEIVTGKIRELEKQVRHFTGTDVSQEVMAGKDDMLAASEPVRRAMWVKEAVDRLDALTTPETCRRIMEACGRACLATNIKGMEESKEIRRRCATEEEFLEIELNAMPEITRYERHGDILYWYYTPRKLGKGIRCVCPLLHGLPEDADLSPAYCRCSRAFVQAYWEVILGRPLKVELGRTAITGAEDCQFIIHL